MTDFDPTDFDGLEEAANERQALASLRDRQEIEDLQAIMGDAAGRRFMWRLLGQTGVYRSSFTGEPHGTIFREGERNVGLRLLAIINRHCADEYAEMQKEHAHNA